MGTSNTILVLWISHYDRVGVSDTPTWHLWEWRHSRYGYKISEEYDGTGHVSKTHKMDGTHFVWHTKRCVAAGSNFTVFDRSNSSDPVQDMDVCRRFFMFVLSCVGRGLVTGKESNQMATTYMAKDVNYKM
jgi:hypothetical protein